MRRGSATTNAYLFLEGVSLRVRRPAGRKRAQMRWPTAFGETPRATCRLFCAARAKAMRIRRVCCRSISARVGGEATGV
jgi:hypothetical protein